MNNFGKTLLTNILIVIALVPMVIILNSLIAWNDSPILWVIVGILSLTGISYLQSREHKPFLCEICGKLISVESRKIYGNTGMCLPCNWGAYNYDKKIKTLKDWKKYYVRKK